MGENKPKGVTSIRSSSPKVANKRVFSIIVPVLNEAEQINSTIRELRNRNGKEDCEIIVADGDPQGSTIKVIQDKSIKTIKSQKGRGRQMNAGAAVACGEILIFLHADTRLPGNALERISRVLENQEYVGGAFGLAIDSDRLLLKYIAARASFRSRLNKIPYGDQAIFIMKGYFDKIGGFKEIPLMEDVELMRRIKKDGKRICILPQKVTTSARRWERDGVFYTTVRNRIFAALFHLGVSPARLAKYYWRNSNGCKD